MPRHSAYRMRPVITASAYRGAVFSQGPVLYWPMQETSGTTVADLVGGNTGTHTSGVSIFNADSVHLAPVAKYPGSGSSNNFTTVPNVVSGPSGLSVEFWARKTGDLNANVVFMLANSGGRVALVHLGWPDGNIYWDCGPGSTFDRINKIRDFTLSDWHHYVFTKNVSTGVMNIYVDGALWHTGSGMTQSIGTMTAGAVGADTSGGNPFDGYVAQFAVYTKELTSTQVAAHYAAATKRTASGTLTLKFDIRPDITSGNAGDITTQALTVNGTSIGTFSSNGANAAGPAVWVTRSYDITSLVTVGNMVSITTAYSSGADTGYFRNMYIQDGTGQTFYGGYPSGGLYDSPFSLTGGAAQYLWAQGGGPPNQFSVLTNSYVSNPSGDNVGHCYIPTRTFTAAL